MIAFETTTRIARPIEEVFAYVSDPLNFPRWNSAVQAVRKTSAGEASIASTYKMERDLPTGRAVNDLEIIAREQPREFAIRTTSGPTPLHYRYRFSADSGETVVQLNGEFELQGPAAFAPALARRAVKRGVEDNLAAVKRILEKRAGLADWRPRGRWITNRAKQRPIRGLRCGLRGDMTYGNWRLTPYLYDRAGRGSGAPGGARTRSGRAGRGRAPAGLARACSGLPRAGGRLACLELA